MELTSGRVYGLTSYLFRSLEDDKVMCKQVACS